MTGTAILLALLSALLHAAWNVRLAAEPERVVTGALAMAVGGLCFMPFALLRASLPTHVLDLLLASAAAEAVYMILLAHAYESGAFTVVYAVARGLAPAFVTLLAWLALRERPGVQVAAGIALLGGGLMLATWRARASADTGRTLFLSATVAALVATYTTIDAAAARGSDPVTFGTFAVLLGGLIALPALAARRGPAVLRSRRGWRGAVLIGPLMLASYVIALAAFTMAPVAPVAALRETGILFAAVLGGVVLHEPVGLRRALGFALVALGAAITSLH